MCVCGQGGGPSVPVIAFKLASRRNRAQHIGEARVQTISLLVTSQTGHFNNMYSTFCAVEHTCTCIWE